MVVPCWLESMICIALVSWFASICATTFFARKGVSCCGGFVLSLRVDVVLVGWLCTWSRYDDDADDDDDEEQE